jgi:murein hydrolase activator
LGSTRKSLIVDLAAMLLLTSVVATHAADDEETRTRQQLTEVKSQISALQSRLKIFAREKSTIQQALRTSETAISEVQKSVRKTRKRLTDKKSQLATLKSERHKLIKAKSGQQKLMAREIQTAYQTGRQSHIKILLNQEDPHTVARAMEYYKYFSNARNERIESYLEIIKKIDALEPQISATALALAKADTELSDQLQQLQQQKSQRKVALSKLNSSIQNSDQKLAQLQKNRSELEELLEAVEQAVANLEIPSDYQAFAKLKGAMIWPVEGKPENRFGQLRSGGPLRWQGLMIDAQEGSPVRAIHHGRVVYADWFRGSGLLLIIDHGDGYMSLYAHNQSLHREVGEWVTANELVSTVGNSGGQFKSALYFEIRHQGKPTDPRKWCKTG